MKLFKAPEDWKKYKQENPDLPIVFLAGSIEGDTAEKWQDKVSESLKDYNIIVLNPRRDDWDNSWKQSIKDKNFNEQVSWELESMENSNIILMYFDKDTKSPISLLELGLFAKTDKLVVVCPDGFWRKGNVDIVCKRYDVATLNTLDKAILELKKWLT